MLNLPNYAPNAVLKSGIISNATMHPGKVYCLKGENGIGKSLYLEYLKIALPHKDKLNFLDQPQIFSFLNLDVENFLLLFKKISPSRFPDKKIEQWMGFDEGVVEQYFKTPIRSLSGGQNQWIKILIAFNLKGEFYFFDEPMLHLDQPKQDHFWKLFQKLIKKDSYYLIVSHEELKVPSYEKLKMEAFENQLILRNEK